MNNQTIKETVQLWLEYVKARQALLTEGIVRSFKSPEADFAEQLIASIFKGVLPSNKSNPAYDVIAGDKRIQVKSVAKTFDNKNGYIIKEKDRNNNPEIGATHYAFVFFNELIPTGIFLVPESFVREFHKTQIKRSDLEKSDCKVAVDLSVFNM
ncbi:MAG: hypothetical protein HND44_03300 [Chloroflexi bacterium]|nr:hypothetical protein [Ardenticatenaceae bacterium]NOG33590.1 hypothetical protein [Chloroflexota bacterium]GIK56546.1 MAG: hypothetical protein BroJett015_22090 [Chloroflexota bacterium]